MRIWLFGLVLLSFSACEINRLNQAEELYDAQNYTLAIKQLDDLIKIAKNGAYRTRAELLRGNCYLELGNLAAANQDVPLSIKFYKLANNQNADTELGQTYLRLSQQAYRANNKALAMRYLNDVLREIPESSLVPEVMLRRISILMDEYHDHNSTWEAYKYLHDNFPNNPFELQARRYVAQFIDNNVNYAVTLTESGYFTDALKELFELARYPVVDGENINKLIANVYQAQAEEYIDAQDYLQADRMFRIAIQYDPLKATEIQKRLEDITSLYIQKGNGLMAARDFENALVHYQKVFDIIPDYAPAQEAIRALYKKQEDIARAAQIFKEAERLESSEKYNDALALFRQAQSLDPLPEYQNHIQTMQNVLEAQKNPNAFAQKIINEYKNGQILKRVAAKRAEVLADYKANEIRDSGWKILLSTGQFKYEARYDLLTPNDTFLYVWQVNLRDRSIIPLNRLSEDVLK